MGRIPHLHALSRWIFPYLFLESGASSGESIRLIGLRPDPKYLLVKAFSNTMVSLEIYQETVHIVLCQSLPVFCGLQNPSWSVSPYAGTKAPCGN